MGRFDRYLLREWLLAFALVLSALTGILLLQQVYADLRDLIELRAAPERIALHFALGVPAHLPLLLPIATLLSALYVVGLFHRHHELTAMRAAGRGVLRLTRGLWLSAGLLTAAVLALNASVIPWSVEQLRLLRADLEMAAEAETRSAAEVGAVANLAFDHRAERRLWMFNRYSQYTGRGYGVSIHELDPRRRERRRLAAREAYYDEDRRQWVLLSGRDLRIDPILGEIRSSVPFDRLEPEGYTEPPSLMLLLAKRARDLSLSELRTLRAAFGPEEAPQAVAWEVRIHAIVAGSLGCLLALALAIPFAVRGVRVNPVVGVTQSLGLFVAFYLVSSFATLAGERAEVAPWLAGWAPTLTLGAVASLLALRLR